MHTHQQRSHLIADTLGGSGSDARNIVALTSGSNHSGEGMSNYERIIRDYVEGGGHALYEVKVHYDGDSPTPKCVHLFAVDANGKTLVDVTIANGIMQNHGCCR